MHRISPKSSSLNLLSSNFRISCQQAHLLSTLPKNLPTNAEKRPSVTTTGNYHQFIIYV